MIASVQNVLQTIKKQSPHIVCRHLPYYYIEMQKSIKIWYEHDIEFMQFTIIMLKKLKHMVITTYNITVSVTPHKKRFTPK